jgi:hypothetical protein
MTKYLLLSRTNKLKKVIVTGYIRGVFILPRYWRQTLIISAGSKEMIMFKNGVTNKKIFIYSLVLAVFIIYPNITTALWMLFLDVGAEELYFFVFRYLYFVVLFWILLSWNLKKSMTTVFAKRLVVSFLIAGAAYGLYIPISLYIFKIHGDHLTVTLVFQYLVTMTICAGIGQVHIMYQHQRLKEMEIEQLKLETLQSRYEALTNQINPHFFFNALNSLTGLIRNASKDQTIKFVDKLSDVFRYILRSDKKGLVELEEELEFMKAYQYLIEIRFAKKLSFNTVVDTDKKKMKLPVLSLLPLIENIVQHNVIDAENKMRVEIYINENNELVISNPVHPKLEQSVSHNIGLVNLDSRFFLLTRRHIRVINDSGTFTVYLPLVEE